MKTLVSLFWWPSEALWLVLHPERSNFSVHILPILASIVATLVLWTKNSESPLWIYGWFISTVIGMIIEEEYVKKGWLFTITMIVYRCLFGFLPISFIATITIVMK